MFCLKQDLQQLTLHLIVALQQIFTYNLKEMNAAYPWSERKKISTKQHAKE